MQELDIYHISLSNMKNMLVLSCAQFTFHTIYVMTLEVNHHSKNGGSFWKIINPY